MPVINAFFIRPDLDIYLSSLISNLYISNLCLYFRLYLYL